MNFVRKLFKPRWQSADAAVRLAAVSADAAPELAAALPQIARGDADAGVRLAALRRLADPGLAQALAQDDPDAGNREAARALWFDLLAGRHAQSPPLTERLRLAAAQDAPRLIEHLAEHAAETELRAAALIRVTRPALLVERATAEPDAKLRLSVVERIDDEALLERIAERSRKRDKQVYRRAKDKIEAGRLARGDDAAIAEEARRICEQLERRLREGDHSAADDDAALQARWNAIADRAPASFRTRFQAAGDLLALRRDPEQMAALRRRGAEIEAIGEEIAAIEHALAGRDAVEQRDAIGQRFDALAERWSAVDDAGGSLREAHEQRLSAIVARLGELANAPAPVPAAPTPAAMPAAAPKRRDDPAETERRRAERERRHAALGAALGALEAALDGGQSGPAHQAHARLAAARQALHEAPDEAIARRLADAEGRYAQIARWQRWSDDQRREALCGEIEALAASGLHPDAVATRVREAQAEWARLDAHDGGRGGGGLIRRFHAACREAIKPTRAYFEKRDALRQTQAQAIAALLEGLDDPNAAALDVRALAARRREIADALRALDRVDPRERKTLAERLRTALATLDARIAEHDGAIEAAKQRLIGAAEALAADADLRSAIASAKDLQRRWQAAGNGRRARDQQQWTAFRAAIDAVFARADGERAARDAQAQAARESAAALCAELESLAAAERAERAAQTRIEQAWQALGLRDDDLQRRFRTAQDALREAAERRLRAERRAGFDAWLTTYALCRAAERGERDADGVRSDLAAIDATPVAAAALSARFERALAGAAIAAPSAADTEALRDCLVELEALAGIDSPDEDRQRRLDLQVGRLSARLRGGDAEGGPEARLVALLERWTAQAPVADPALDDRLERAVRHVLAGWR
ncbi:MAG TPA: DUF349 domain-containing protein [Dokdonella sp.]|uniref:DUF349 domain-containing protein n=1 Tax=Dokdonella sp. TaxID=2291710 RepID=UPI002BE73BEF|nr:DUF349 domain-containing protein [Dokdonella sp.]HUD40386.1 DUF349 domain-containing protein [Dokdonella sp.]